MASHVQVTCPSCKTRLRFAVPEGDAERLRVRCSVCEAVFTIRPRPGQGDGSPEERQPAGGQSTESPSAQRRAAESRAAENPPEPAASETPSYTAALSGAGAPSEVPSSQQPTRVEGAPLRPRGEPALELGAVLAGRYRLVRFIARGGMGEVYEAEDQELRERVAVKTVRPEVADNLAVDRFKREIQLARKVTHPNVCRIYDVVFHRGEDGSTVTFLTMELLAGKTLSERLEEEGPMDAATALPLVRQMAEGLQAAHQAGVVHRDFKSRNVVLVPSDSGVRAVITDFGLARGEEGVDVFGSELTVTDGVIGTPAYMAPEQVEGGHTTAAVDIYALGVVLYEMRTGKVPFQGENALSTAVMRLKERPPSPRLHVPDIEARWERTMLRCLEREPGERFGGPAEVVNSLRLPQRPSGPRPAAAPAPPPPAPPARRRLRDRLVAGGLIVLIALIGLFVFLQVRSWRREQSLGGFPAEVEPRRAVAVLGFRNLGGAADRDWLGTALTEMIAAELGAGEDLRVVSGESVARMRADLGVAEPSTLAPDTLAYARGMLGADYLVVGSYLVQGGGGGERLRLDFSLQDAALGETVLTDSATGGAGDLLGLVERVGPRLRTELGARQLEAGHAGGAGAALPSSAEAARLYAEGLERLRHFDPQAGRDLLLQAVAAEPGHALAHSALSSAHSALGYSGRALEAARRAFELSEGLPREEALWVEARYRELSGDWEQALSLYRGLWTSFPDDLDYGVQLAAAQTAAGAPSQALETLEVLRRILPPDLEDPRLDLAEASAAEALADFGRQQRAASRAALLARQSRARLLLARARAVESWALRNLGRSAAAESASNEAREIYAEVGDAAGVAFALTNLGNLMFDRGDLPRARQAFEEALEAYARVGDKASLARTLNNLALLDKREGLLEAARQRYRRSLALCEETASDALVGHVLQNLGTLESREGRLEVALGQLERALEIQRRIGDRAGEAYALDSIGTVLRKQGGLAEAAERHRAALVIWRAVGQRQAEAATLEKLGRAALLSGDLDTADKSLKEAEVIVAELGHRSLEATLAHSRATLVRARGDATAAEQLERRALEARTQLGEAGQVAESQLSLAWLLLGQRGRVEAADLCAQAAYELDLEGLADGHAQALACQATARSAAGDLGAARVLLEQALEEIAASESLEARWPVILAEGRLRAALGQPDRALEILDPALAELAAAGFKGFELEGRLVRWEIAFGVGQADRGDGVLVSVEREAEDLGFAGLARRALELRL